jgi:hypothetical protein
MTMRALLMIAAIGLTTINAPPGLAQHGAAPQSGHGASPGEVTGSYAPYAYLIGNWDIAVPAGQTLRETFRWGPRQSYIFFSTLMSQGGQPESVHFEGMAVWNGATNRLDYVFVLEPGSGGQERGEIYVQADGLIVRDVTLTDRNGRSGRFRQTFQRTGVDSAITSVMRQTATGWEPTFPGGERLVMTRRRS